MALPACAYVASGAVRSVVEAWIEDPQLSVYLTPSARQVEVDAVGTHLRSVTGVRDVRFISREQALKALSKIEGLGELVDALEGNPLPHAYVAQFPADAAPTVDQIAVAVRKLPGVDRVQIDSDWTQRLGALLGIVHRTAALLAVLLGLVVGAVTLNTVRMQILTQKDEIDVSRLIGATDGFVRRPFLYLGALLGAAGAVFGWVLVFVAVSVINAPLGEFARLYGSTLRLLPLGAFEFAACLLVLVAIGLVGAAISVRNHLLMGR
jgi:cell division transport system permease protein